jgi:hypothetical protein
MFPLYINTVRSLNNSKGIKHSGLGKALPYYRNAAKSEKSKHLTVVTGIKKDIDINIADIDTNSDIYQLFYREKEEEITKRWQTELGETLLKRKAENFKINWANLDNWNQTQNEAVEKNALSDFNRIVYASRRFYFGGILPFECGQLDGTYGSFVPIFKAPTWQFDWNSKPQTAIKIYGQTQVGCSAVPSSYTQNIQLGSVPIYRSPRLLLPTPKTNCARRSYIEQLHKVRKNWQFYNLFKLQIYKFGRHDSFTGGQAKRYIKRRQLVWWGKRPRFHYKPSYLHLTGTMFRKNHPFQERFSSVHEFALKGSKLELPLFANDQLSIIKIKNSMLPTTILFPEPNDDDEFDTSKDNLLKAWQMKYAYFTHYNNQEIICISSMHTFNTYKFNMPTSRQQLILLDSTLERHWPKIVQSGIIKKMFPNYIRKYKRRNLLGPISYGVRTKVQRLSERLANRFEKLQSYILKTVLLLVVAHQKLVKLNILNIPKFEPIVNILAAGLIRRQRLGQNIQIVFNKIFASIFLNKFRFNGLRRSSFSIIPGQYLNSFAYLNHIDFPAVGANCDFSTKSLIALETIIPTALLPLLASIGNHTPAVRISLDLETKHFHTAHFANDLYRQFIDSFGFRYYYADRLPFAMRTSLQFKSTLELNDSKTLLVGSISNKLLLKVVWLRGIRKINFYRELLRQRLLKERFF